MDYQASTQANVKQKNQQLILQLLVNEGAMSRAELAKKMKSTKPTISKNVDSLLREKILVEVGKDDNLVGKKGILLDLNGDYGYVLGIDLSKNSFSLVLSNLKNEWLNYSRVLLDGFFEPKKDLQLGGRPQPDILEVLEAFIQECSIKPEQIRLVSIAYPGVIGHNDAVYLTNLKFKEVLLNQLIQYIQNGIKKPLIIKNDINLAAIAEKKYGKFSDKAHLYLLSADVGVGLGLIINHRLYEGERNAAGEVGFILPIQSSKGRFYTLEERVSINALTKRYNERTGKTTTFEELIEKVTMGEEVALELYEDVLLDISVAIMNIASVLDIKTVVLDGRVFNLHKDMIRSLNSKINQIAPFETSISKTTLDKMSLRGAVTLGIESVISGLV